MHESGGDGSHGYNYDWLLVEAEKNVLRTHTTAVSSRVLRALSLRGFTPGKYFSIDRVFRNESIDKTHLAEFHQIEGIIIDRNIGLGDLIGVLQQFFERLGVSPIRFKPAYNPYTEPSMEIFTYIEGLDKWVEIGNSGIFRPEMLGPMGLSSDVTAIAWGLSLERPTMKLYGINNIRFENCHFHCLLSHFDRSRDLFGPGCSMGMIQVSSFSLCHFLVVVMDCFIQCVFVKCRFFLIFIQSNPVCRMGEQDGVSI
jgi:phenylalanyl-tRNA synthetase alpha subunit